MFEQKWTGSGLAVPADPNMQGRVMGVAAAVDISTPRGHTTGSCSCEGEEARRRRLVLVGGVPDEISMGSCRVIGGG